MDAILTYLMLNKTVAIVLALVTAYAISRVLAPPIGTVLKDDLVPQFKRFNRREDSEGNRRHPRALRFTGVERRIGLRRVHAS